MNGRTSFTVCVQQFFRDYLECQKGCTANTLDSYSVTFSQLIEFLGFERIKGLTIEQLGKEKVIIAAALRIKRGSHGIHETS